MLWRVIFVLPEFSSATVLVWRGEKADVLYSKVLIEMRSSPSFDVNVSGGVSRIESQSSERSPQDMEILLISKLFSRNAK